MAARRPLPRGARRRAKGGARTRVPRPRPALEEAVGRIRHARAVLAEHGGGPPLPPDLSFDGGDAEVASWQLCAAAPVSAYDAQRLLATDDTTERLRLLVELMDELELDLQRMLNQE